MKRADGIPLRLSAGLSLVLLPLAGLAMWLGVWQMDRMHEKQALVDNFETGQSMSLRQAIADEAVFARIHASGRYETEWQLLLDNKILQGRVGVHVLSLFRPDQGAPVLVNRGWLPMPADRRSLPDVPTPTGPMNLTGILSRPPEDGVRLGEAENLEGLQGPTLITYLDIREFKSAVPDGLSNWLVLLDESDLSGFQGRDWKPAVMLPSQHRAYAFQWFALAIAILIMWFARAWKRGTDQSMPDRTDPGNKP